MANARNRPRVCFICLNTYTYFESQEDVSPGGAERQLYLLGQGLQSEFDVHFVVGDYGQPETERRDGVTLHRAYRPVRTAPLYRRARHLLELFRAMRRADADVYVFRDDRTKAVITFLFAKVLGRKWVYNLAIDSQADSGDGPLSSPFLFLFDRIIGYADHVIAQSPVQQRRLDASFGVDSTVVPNGYPPLEFDRPDREREYFLYVGRIDREQKRPHVFLELARELPDESFVLIGPMNKDEAYYRRIESEAESLDNVEFVGQVEPDDVFRYYEPAIALVNTSSQEGFPNTFLEAWRSETPVLSLDVDPGRFNGGDSSGYANGDLAELAAKARKLSESPDERRSIGTERREYFEENLTLSAVSSRYAAALRSCLE